MGTTQGGRAPPQKITRVVPNSFEGCLFEIGFWIQCIMLVVGVNFIPCILFIRKVMWSIFIPCLVRLYLAFSNLTEYADYIIS